MKKLMIAAAAAAMIVGVQAAECYTWTEKDECSGEKTKVTAGATAYKVAISLKSTDFKKKNVKVTCGDSGCVYWREQSTKKIDGLIWQYYGCDCDVCDLLNDEGYEAAFWTKKAPYDAEFAIGVGRIGKKGDKLEAYGKFGDLSWAGFGSLKEKTNKNTCGDDSCNAYVKSITGGIAGCLEPWDFEQEDDPCGCADECEEIEYDVCCDLEPLTYRAAYGTIKISYDKSTAKKLAKIGEESTDIRDFYKLPAAVADDVESAPIVIEE